MASRSGTEGPDLGPAADLRVPLDLGEYEPLAYEPGALHPAQALQSSPYTPQLPKERHDH